MYKLPDLQRIQTGSDDTLEVESTKKLRTFIDPQISDDLGKKKKNK